MHTMIETQDLVTELRKLAASAVFAPRVSAACGQAADLIGQLRPILLAPEPQLSDQKKVQKLKELIAHQGDG